MFKCYLFVNTSSMYKVQLVVVVIKVAMHRILCSLELVSFYSSIAIVILPAVLVVIALVFTGSKHFTKPSH